jgi:XRE family transcriptional regulator, regulator of sulfur utilization
MSLHQQIVLARKKKGFTQEELAEATGVTVRTIQRIETGQTAPRSYTLKNIAAALGLDFEALGHSADVQQAPSGPNWSTAEDTAHFLRMLCLSCFTYIILPYLHFLIPAQLLKRKQGLSAEAIHFGKRLIFWQVCWIIATVLTFLLCLAYNFIAAAYLSRAYLVSYLWPFFIMYLTNAILILIWLRRAKRVAQPIISS